MIDPPPPVTGTMRNPTKADVEALSRRLVRSYGPPVTSASVFALAVSAAMWEAVELVELAEVSLARHGQRRADGMVEVSDYAAATYYGQIYTANKIMRAVYDSLNPGKGVDPGLRLATRRGVCGLLQREVAATVGMDRGNYAKIESGQRYLYPHHAEKFAEILGCTPGYLLTGEGGRP